MDLTKALEKHYDPELALKKVKEVHEWLTGALPKSNEELVQKGWKKGYNLTTWTEMPGEIDSRNISSVILQVMTGGRMGLQNLGPGETFRKEAKQLRSSLEK